MITLTIQNLKTKETHIELIDSKDEAEKRLAKLITNPEVKEKVKKGEYLESYSYDTQVEKALIESYLPDDRKCNGVIPS